MRPEEFEGVQHVSVRLEVSLLERLHLFLREWQLEGLLRNTLNLPLHLHHAGFDRNVPKARQGD